MTSKESSKNHPWWRGASFYQVYPRSFADSNADGTGDIQGIISKLDYLNDLGIDAIWMSPFYPSPWLDGGYDVADPRGVAPELGTLDDFRELVSHSNARDIKVIVDVVPNHVSREHVWFQSALASAPGSPERARFHFLDGRGPGGNKPPNNWISVFGGSAWTRIEEADGTPGQWYLHLFDTSQPDLNWTNPEIIEDSLATLRFWLDLGVSGFRVDVAIGMSKDMTYADSPDPQGLVDAIRLDLFDPAHPEDSLERRKLMINSPIFDRDEVHEFFGEWRKVLDSYDGDRFAVAEAWAYPTNRAMQYAVDLGQVFNFDFLIVPFEAETIISTIDRIVLDAATVNAPPTWVLSNHDTARVVSRLGDRDESFDQARAMAVLAHSLPGGVYIYQGEELGLSDAEIPDDKRQDPIWERSGHTDKGRDGGRVPLPWDNTKPNYGFGTSDPNALWLPQPTDWNVAGAAQQVNDPHSTLSLYRRLLELRHTHPAWVNPDGPITTSVDRDDHGNATGVLRVIRQDKVLILVNTDKDPHMVAVGEFSHILCASGPNQDPPNSESLISLAPNHAVILGQN